ncbi:MAG TPA: hypothetical protein VHV27_07295 [Phenylobacterium sp.]|jgi:hypothetical protein|nr:hypothetical protein [Phenylobacterium sp.]
MVLAILSALLTCAGAGVLAALVQLHIERVYLPGDPESGQGH